MPRSKDPAVDDAIKGAALELLSREGFVRMTMEGIAAQAGVGKPALYRRFPDKAALVVAVINSQLPALDVPRSGDTRAELWEAVRRGFPQDGPTYGALIGGLIAEQQRHPELMEAFRRRVLGPRRALVQALIEDGQQRGDIRGDIGSVAALDLLAGPLLARIFAGVDTGPRWRKKAFQTWWDLVKERTDS